MCKVRIRHEIAVTVSEVFYGAIHEVEVYCACFFFSSRRRHTRFDCDWSSDVCSSDLVGEQALPWLPVEADLAADVIRVLAEFGYHPLRLRRDARLEEGIGCWRGADGDRKSVV